jgi:hypothetical protein
MTKSVAILGCGPAGLMVAHAAQQSNWALQIYSKRQKSQLHGAQYLHQAIPGINCGGPNQVSYRLHGTPEQYRKKVYGEVWDGTVSPEDFMEEHSAWDLRAAYNWLWKMYEPWIVDCDIPRYDSDKMIYYPIPWRSADLVISTVPRTVWDSDNGHFERIQIWALGDSDPDGGLASQPDFTVVCDGTNLCSWYRSAKIFGHSTLEWPYYPMWEKPPMYGAVIVTKPLRYTGNAAPDFIHLGRYGAWEKGILTSDVFYQAMKIFAEDRI